MGQVAARAPKARRANATLLGILKLVVVGILMVARPSIAAGARSGARLALGARVGMVGLNHTSIIGGDPFADGGFVVQFGTLFLLVSGWEGL